jgi:hypothetical protein
MKNFIFPMNLQLFAEGGAAAGDGGAGQGTGETAQAAAVQSKGVTAPAAGVQPKGAKSNPLANVFYGKPAPGSAPAAEVQKEPEQQPSVDLDAEFEELIKGKYKDQFGKKMQNTVQKVRNSSKETEERLAAMSPMLDILSARYGKEASDIAGMIKALESDDAFFEQAAMEKNMDVNQYRNMLKLQSENARLKAKSEEQFRKDMMAKRFAVWNQQAEQAKTFYPNLDLAEEMQNPQFCKLLDSGVDVKSAYKVLHDEEITAQLLEHQAKSMEKKFANKIAAGSIRPTENGASGQSAAIIKTDPSNWTKADRAEVRRRVARGERIML